MNLEKLYFENIDANFCQSLKYFIRDAQIEGLEQITIIEAVPDKETKDFIWCTEYGEVTEREGCRKSQCSHYSSKSGRGVCKHRGNLYLHGEEVTFKIPTNEP